MIRPSPGSHPTFSEAVALWWRIGLLSFGGPAGQIALMHRALVEEKRWVDEPRFLHALNFCMLLPGPEAQQLATYIGWLLHGVRGGLVAGGLFVLPGAVVILIFSVIYATFQQVPLLAATFLGIKAAVLVIVVEALLRIARRIVKNAVMLSIAGLAFVAIFVFGLPFPVIVIAAAVCGSVGARMARRRFAILNAGVDDHLDRSAETAAARPTLLGSLRTLALGLTLWVAPIVLAAALLGTDHVFVAEGLFFSKLATVTFGGAYAVLAYMAQEAVGVHAWLSTGEMIDGLGLAESTPGPLIMVTQFVGFLGALRNPGPIEPMLAALLGSLLTVWVTFVPCFLWIFLGAPYLERLRGNVALGGALSAITAAVVDVIANLALWFGLQVLFREVSVLRRYGMEVLLPDVTSVDVTAVALTALAAVALFVLHRGVLSTLLISALVALAVGLV